MDNPETAVVTGAFGYTGSYIADRLLAAGFEVKTLTSHPDRPSPNRRRIKTAPFNFDNPAQLTRELQGTGTLYNTYWIRVPRGGLTFQRAVEHSLTLIRAARDAGVRRIVHLSIANPDETSPLLYYSGKAQVERAVVDSGIPYSILRPTVVFGPQDILINNIAWALRRLPAFFIPGSGDYLLQPVFVEDLADLAVQTGMRQDNITTDAVGPEIYTFRELVGYLAEATGSAARIVRTPPSLALAAAQAVGFLVRDVMLTKDELKGLMSNLLVSHGPATCQTKFSEWLSQHAESIGARYASELNRHYR